VRAATVWFPNPPRDGFVERNKENVQIKVNDLKTTLGGEMAAKAARH
jgi:hypothetical protein